MNGVVKDHLILFSLSFMNIVCFAFLSVYVFDLPVIVIGFTSVINGAISVMFYSWFLEKYFGFKLRNYNKE